MGDLSMVTAFVVNQIDGKALASLLDVGDTAILDIPQRLGMPLKYVK
eukprot:SAG11_NODE_20400_length_446_cov_0.743516_1_plen_46_part_10